MAITTEIYHMYSIGNHKKLISKSKNHLEKVYGGFFATKLSDNNYMEINGFSN